MRQYNNKISLVQNNRWVWDLDPFKWCYYWTLDNKKGCYWLCYAANIAKFRWFDFKNVVYRDFEDEKHLKEIWRQLLKIPFVRLWTMCDPSHDWKHTIKIIEQIKKYNKNIVIITKHWTTLTDKQILKLKWICINTSISALDTKQQIEHRLRQYNRLKNHCNSVLRVNTCDFKESFFNEEKDIQEKLLKNENVIDNVLRFPKSNEISFLSNVKKYEFLGKKIFASKHNNDIYMWNCSNCKELCWIWLFN